MSENLSQRVYISFLVFACFFGLLLATLPAFFRLSVQEDFQWRKPLVGSVFGLICFLGVIAVFFPSRCSTVFRDGEAEGRNHVAPANGETSLHKKSAILGLKVTHGHHPDCEGFAAHEFRFGRKTFCTACMGLLLGALAALLGVAAYFFLGWNLGENVSLLLVSGALGVGLGLLHYMFFDVQRRLVRLLLNAFFVFGTFLVLASTDAVANSLILDLFVVFLSILWLFTRILLSKRIHSKICQACSSKCEVYKR
ncbi:MAG: hypothetical protein ACE5KC_01235 [Candidatus Bathyarchaeia archaeon]